MGCETLLAYCTQDPKTPSTIIQTYFHNQPIMIIVIIFIIIIAYAINFILLNTFYNWT